MRTEDVGCLQIQTQACHSQILGGTRSCRGFLCSCSCGCKMQDMQWEVHPTERAAHGQEAEWWLPDADISSAVVTEKNFGSMMSSLRDVSKKEITQKLKAMEAERHKFHFQACFSHPHRNLGSPAPSGARSQVILVSGDSHPSDCGQVNDNKSCKCV